MTTLDIRAPQDQTEGTRSQVLRWLKSIGESVSEHEPLIEIETDKVTVEVPSPASGVLREIVKAEQEEIQPGDVLGRLEASVASVVDGASDSVAASKPGQPQSVVGSEPRRPSTSAADSGSVEHPLRHPLSPAVRRLLAERGLDATSVRGTGEGGRITIDDVLAYGPSAASAASSRFAESTPADNAGGESQRADAPVAERSARVRRVPHSAIRKRIAEHMVESLLHTAPHVTTVFEADLSAILEHRTIHRSQFENRGAPLTLTAYFVSAIVQAIEAVPEANSRWTDSALEIHEDINIGIATALEGVGLVVPVLHDVASLDLFGIAEGIHRLATAAREGRLAPSDMRGGTFTISNHGVSGSLLAAPIIINQPQSAILGVGKMEKRPVVVEEGDSEKIVVRPKCYVTLTIDHRVMDGHLANRFLQTFVRTLEAWPAP